MDFEWRSGNCVRYSVSVLETGMQNLEHTSSTSAFWLAHLNGFCKQAILKTILKYIQMFSVSIVRCFAAKRITWVSTLILLCVREYERKLRSERMWYARNYKSFVWCTCPSFTVAIKLWNKVEIAFSTVTRYDFRLFEHTGAAITVRFLTSTCMAYQWIEKKC